MRSAHAGGYNPRPMSPSDGQGRELVKAQAEDDVVPPSLIGFEVSVRALKPLWHALRVKQVDPQQVLEGIDYPLEHMTDGRRRISWQAFHRFAANMGRVFGDEELIEIGAISMRSPFLSALMFPGQLLFGVNEIYQWLFGPSGPPNQLFAAHRCALREIAPGKLRLEMFMKKGYEPSRENYLLLRGSLSALSQTFGVLSKVVQHPLTNGAAYEIEVPSNRGLISSARNAYHWIFAARSTAEELRRTHVELHQRCIELEREIEVRSRAETERVRLEKQLRQAQKMEAVGRLAGGVAHDFNNLLSVILSNASLVLEDLEPMNPLRTDIEEIKKAGDRAADLTKQLLAFSRQQVLEPKVLDLNEVVRGMDKMIRRLVGEDVEVFTTARPDLGRIKADPGHIEQVILNLAVNARDAMPRGGRLTMETGNAELDETYAAEHVGVTPGAYVMLAVSDTGIGMDKATQDRIFEPFFTTKAKGKGTGLGLSTVFGIVQQSGGSIWVYSEPNQGTTFKVFLPLTNEVEQPVTPVRLGSLRGSETVLLVEDDDQVRAVALGILSRNGYRILEGRNANEALQLSARHEGPIELLLTDVVMPHMSGSELADKLVEGRPDTRVLYMSGYTDEAIVHHRVVAPGVTLLQKPLTPEGLLRKVREVLEAPRSLGA